MTKKNKELLARTAIGVGAVGVLVGCILVFTNFSRVYQLTAACDTSQACRQTLNNLNDSVHHAYLAIGGGLLIFGVGGVLLAHVEDRLHPHKKKGLKLL